ncbi:MAG: glycosyltransferase family 4 protein [Chloroflexi bacterium]|nr:glycosyltransferase family 4 protein [Chloroflexota bacterium]
MRIALNAQLLSTSASYRTAGINRVIYHLLDELPRVPGDEEYLVYAPASDPNRQLLSRPRVRRRLTHLPVARPPVRIAWEQSVLPLELLRERADLLHALGFVSPFGWRGRSVVTVYDLSFLRFPEVFNRGNRFYLGTFTPSSLRRADRVITISESTRQDVIELCGVAPERVTPILLAADERFRPATPTDIGVFRQQYSLPERFILYLGTLEPRKNIETLVRAYARLREHGSTDHILVLAGGRGWLYDTIFALVQSLGLADYVRFPGFVPAEQQALWYSSATVFAFPSRFEGFGLPLLEAMACGTPVVSSWASSLPEVVGDAGRLVDPSDVEGLSAALCELMNDETLRAELSAAGLARAATFSWRRMAEETVQVYREVLQS